MRKKKISTDVAQQIGKSRQCVICVFGESNTGKTTLLRSLLHDIVGDSKYSICDAEGFNRKDMRVVSWCEIGSQQIIVAIGTSGDRWGIIKASIEFFKKHLQMRNEWAKNRSLNGKTRDLDACATMIPAVLVIATRKPLCAYRGWKEFAAEFDVLNMPINVDAWYLCDNKRVPQWMLPVRLSKESLLENIRYFAINGGKTKQYPSKPRKKIKCTNVEAYVSQDC